MRQELLCKFEKVTYARNAPLQRHALNQNFKGSNKHSPPQTILLQRNGRDANVQRKSEGIAINYRAPPRHPSNSSEHTLYVSQIICFTG